MTYAYKNNVLVDSKNLSISINDYGFYRGYAIFELMRCYNAKPFRLAEHLDRLFTGLKALNMPIKINRKQLEQQIYSLLEKNAFKESVIKIYVTLGEPIKEEFSFAKSVFNPQVFVLNKQFKPFSDKYPYNESYYKNGLNLFLAKNERVIPTVKTNSYVSAIQQSLLPENKGCDDLLYINNQGFVTELSRANIFFFKGGTVYGPKSKLLQGVTKIVIINDVLPACSLKYQEKNITIQDIQQMDGAFSSASISEIMPIAKIATSKVFNKEFFAVAAKVHRQLKNVVAREC